MKTFTGWEYLLIDLANHFGLDKMLFEDRIQWATDNLNNLESLADMADSKPLYLKAVMAIRDAQAGKAIGHVIGLDACCSGIQVMSALTGCTAGASATGLVDPDVRADAYSLTTEVMNTIMGGGVTTSRSAAKEALMTSFYGSKAKPKEIFGEDTPELEAFYKAAYTVAPGAWELLQDLLASWQPYALSHSWKLPDGFDARVKVMEKKTARIEVDELDHATFTHEFYDNEGTATGRANVANVVHSVDAYILRSIQRRCNYDVATIINAATVIEIELIKRSLCPGETLLTQPQNELLYYVIQYVRSGMADIVIAPYLDEDAVGCLSTEHLKALNQIIYSMLEYRPFEVITVHDEFKVHPNNANHLRQQYINIFAEIADSNLLDDLLSQVHGMPGHFQKLSTDLSTKIRGSNYALS